MIQEGLVLAGNDISAGGLVTALLEMCFANKDYGVAIDLSAFQEDDLVKILFSENPGVVVQVKDQKRVQAILDKYEVHAVDLGAPTVERRLRIKGKSQPLELDIDALRDLWFRTSFLLDRKQSGEELAGERFANYKTQPLYYRFPKQFDGSLASLGLDQVPAAGQRKAKAAIIREKGVNGDREMAYTLYLDRKSTRLNSSHVRISYAVFCLKKKKK